MTPLNNQELKEKIAGIYDNPEDPEYCLEDLISEKAMNQLLALFESELANREREACKKGFIKGGIDEIIRNDKSRSKYMTKVPNQRRFNTLNEAIEYRGII